MRKILAAFMALILALSLFVSWTGTGLASEDQVEFTATVNPTQLYQYGTVMLSVSIKNNMPEPPEPTDPPEPTPPDNMMKNVKVTVTNSGFTQIDQSQYGFSLNPGEQKILHENYAITEEMLDKDIELRLTWKESDETYQKDIKVKVTRKQSTPNLKISRTVSSQVAALGGEVTLTYRLQNLGYIDLKNITITDPAVGAAPVTSKFDLKANDPEKKITKKIQVDGEIESKPVVTYDWYGGNVIDDKTSPIVISIAEGAVSADLKADKTDVKRGETVVVSCELQNTGNVDLKEIIVTDELDNVVKDGLSLKAGAKTTLTREYVIDATRTIAWKLSAKDSLNSPLTQNLGSITINVPIDPSTVKLTLSAVPSVSSLDGGPGKVAFKITVNNDSEVDISNVVVMDMKTGTEVGRVETLPPGEKVFNYETIVEDSDPYTFALTATDISGNSYSQTSAPVVINVTAPTQPPTPSPAAPTNSTGSGGMGTLIIVMIVIVALIIISAIVLIILVIQERKAKKLSAERRKNMLALGDEGEEDGIPPAPAVPARASSARTTERPVKPSVAPAPPAKPAKKPSFSQRGGIRGLDLMDDDVFTPAPKQRGEFAEDYAQKTQDTDRGETISGAARKPLWKESEAAQERRPNPAFPMFTLEPEQEREPSSGPEAKPSLMPEEPTHISSFTLETPAAEPLPTIEEVEPAPEPMPEVEPLPVVEEAPPAPAAAPEPEPAPKKAVDDDPFGWDD